MFLVIAVPHKQSHAAALLPKAHPRQYSFYWTRSMVDTTVYTATIQQFNGKLHHLYPCWRLIHATRKHPTFKQGREDIQVLWNSTCKLKLFRGTEKEKG